jgi:uncharacterized protein (TIGR00251 family)
MLGFFHGAGSVIQPDYPALASTAVMNQPTRSSPSIDPQQPAYAFMSTAGSGHLCLHVVPNARQTFIDGLHGEPTKQALKIRLQAPPVDGKANEALLKWLAQLLGVNQSELHIERGHNSRLKQLRPGS